MATNVPLNQVSELGQSVERNESRDSGCIEMQDMSCASSCQSNQTDAVSKPPRQGRILNTSALDGLRALAVFHIVLGHHTMLTNWTYGKCEDWSNKEKYHRDRFSDGFDLMGGVSMGLFYILSGFLLMVGYGNDDSVPKRRWSLCGCRFVEAQPGALTWGMPGAFDSRKFYWKRFARLGPLWYIGNILAFPLFFTNWIGPPDRWWIGAWLMLPPLGLNSWFVYRPPACHLWTLSTMTFFYLIFPKLYHRVRRIQPKNLRAFVMMCYVIQLGLMLVSDIWVGEFDSTLGYWAARAWPPIRLPVFVMGLCAARQCELEAGDPAILQCCCSFKSCGLTQGGTVIVLISIFLLVVLTGIALQFVKGPNVARFCGEGVLPIVFYELVVALTFPTRLAEPPSRLHELLQGRLLRWFADISLGVYIVHETLIRTFALVWRGPNKVDAKGLMPSNADTRMTPWACGIVLLLSIFLGWFVTRFVEKPMSKLILTWALNSHT